MDHGREEDCVKCDKANPGSDFHRNSIARILTPVSAGGGGVYRLPEVTEGGYCHFAFSYYIFLFLHVSLVPCLVFFPSSQCRKEHWYTPKLINMGCFFNTSVSFWKNVVRLLEIKVLDTAWSCLFQGNCVSFVSPHFVSKSRKNTAVWAEEHVFWWR